ncbi:hypothetical protein [Paraburkholderia sp. GAS82]|uniref:hypothetical protein n=1 Tax=Paraburkholderia sp. GAS82 TaxID=3035137 RepID=UPI003D229349
MSDVIVCGESGTTGVTYVEVGGRPATCGEDASGNTLVLQVASGVAGDGPVDGGFQVGFDVGGAVLGVMAMAFAFRLLRRLIDSPGGDGS